MNAAREVVAKTYGTKCPRPDAVNTFANGTPHMPIGIAVQKNSVASIRRLALASVVGAVIVVFRK
jgi:hypothetical protein